MKAANFNFRTTEKKMEGMTVFNSNKVDTKKQSMFFGQPLGVQRYDQYKYPTFDRLTQQQLGYFWRPEEVSLQKRSFRLCEFKTRAEAHLYFEFKISNSS